MLPCICKKLKACNGVQPEDMLIGLLMEMLCLWDMMGDMGPVIYAHKLNIMYDVYLIFSKQ